MYGMNGLELATYRVRHSHTEPHIWRQLLLQYKIIKYV